MTTHVDENCIFCKIVAGKIPSHKLADTDKTIAKGWARSYAFLDIGPLSKGHALVIPKYHGAKLHDVPEEHLTEVVAVARKIAIAQGLVDYNILQNNGRLAHQEVDHVHFHVIPKPTEEEGLGVRWNQQKADQGELAKLAEAIKSKMYVSFKT